MRNKEGRYVRSVKCILFDCAQTLLLQNWTLILTSLARWSTKEQKEIKRILWDSYYTDVSPLYLADLGRVDKWEEFVELLRYELDLDPNVPDHVIRDRLQNCFDFIPGMRELVLRLGNIPTLGIVSNTNIIQGEFLEAAFPTLFRSGVFDFHVFSYREGLAKPDPMMFLRAFSLAGDIYRGKLGEKLKLADCLVVDDCREHVSGARSIGMQAALMEEPTVRCMLRILADYEIELTSPEEPRPSPAVTQRPFIFTEDQVFSDV